MYILYYVGISSISTLSERTTITEQYRGCIIADDTTITTLAIPREITVKLYAVLPWWSMTRAPRNRKGRVYKGRCGKKRKAAIPSYTTGLETYYNAAFPKLLRQRHIWKKVNFGGTPMGLSLSHFMVPSTYKRFLIQYCYSGDRFS